MPNNFINLTQSSWTKGMQSRILSARNDTDILAKGAAILDNVVIMQQGGLQKRPCAIKTNTSIPNGHSFIGVIKFFDGLWVLSYDNNYTVAFSKMNTNIVKLVDISRPHMVFAPNKITFTQDGNTILFLPFWVDVTYVDDNTFNKTLFEFNSYSVSPNKRNSVFFTNYNPSQNVRVHFVGTLDPTSLAQAQNRDSYISVGNKVIIYTDRDIPMQTEFLLYSIWNINGLVIKILDFNTQHGKALIGVVMYGSSSTLPSEKVAQAWLDGWTNIYTISILSGDITILSPNFGKLSNTYNEVYPEIVTNYQNRLITAIVKSNAPVQSEIVKITENNTTLWCSATSNKFSYLQTTREDDSPFSVVISGDISPKILNIVAGDFLYIFTDNGVYAFTNDTNSTFTTNNINLKKIGNHRCNKVKPTLHDNQLFYVQENGKSILSISSENNNVLDADRTILCPTFMSNVSHLCSSNYIRNNAENIASDNSSYLFALSDEVDQESGLLTGRKCILSYQFMSYQGLDGWTRWTFEKHKYPTDIFTFQDKLFAKFYNDNNIYEFVMGVYTDDLSIPSIPKVKIKTNPFALRDAVNGDLLFKHKKYSKICVYYINTSTLNINGETYNVGSLLNGQEPSPKSDVLEVTQNNGYKILNDIEITHQDNSDFKMIALQVRLEVGE